MKKSRSLKAAVRGLACMLVATTTMICTLSNEGRAMLAPSQAVGPAAPPDDLRAADLKTVQAALESKVVRQRLKGLGLSDEQAQARLSRLSDKELHQLAAQIHTLSPGGDGGLLIGLLTVAVLVLLIIYLVKRV